MGFSTRKRCLIGIPIQGYQNFYPCPQKIGFWAQKRPNLAQNWHFGPNISIFGPFYLRPDQKTMRTSCRSGFLLWWQGGITCGAIDEPRKSSKAIDERVIINFRDKNVVIARFRDKNVVIARFRNKNALSIAFLFYKYGKYI